MMKTEQKDDQNDGKADLLSSLVKLAATSNGGATSNPTQMATIGKASPTGLGSTVGGLNLADPLNARNTLFGSLILQQLAATAAQLGQQQQQNSSGLNLNTAGNGIKSRTTTSSLTGGALAGLTSMKNTTPVGNATVKKESGVKAGQQQSTINEEDEGEEDQPAVGGAMKIDPKSAQGEGGQQQPRRRSRCKSSNFRGVSRCAKDGRWQARIRTGRAVKYLGRFKTEVDAARRYDIAARQYHGPRAVLNFADLSLEELIEQDRIANGGKSNLPIITEDDDSTKDEMQTGASSPAASADESGSTGKQSAKRKTKAQVTPIQLNAPFASDVIGNKPDVSTADLYRVAPPAKKQRRASAMPGQRREVHSLRRNSLPPTVQNIAPPSAYQELFEQYALLQSRALENQLKFQQQQQLQEQQRKLQEAAKAAEANNGDNGGAPGAINWSNFLQGSGPNPLLMNLTAGLFSQSQLAGGGSSSASTSPANKSGQEDMSSAISGLVSLSRSHTTNTDQGNEKDAESDG